MSEIPNRSDYLREPDEYTTAELSAFAREIVTRGCDDTAYSTKLEVSWENEEEWVSLTTRDLTLPYPTYQLKVRNKTVFHFDEHVYLMREDHPNVSHFVVDGYSKKNNPVEHSDQAEVLATCMGYLRRQQFPFVYEPRSAECVEQLFSSIMANLAIDSAAAEGLIDLHEIAARYAAGNPISETTISDAVLLQGIRVGEETHPFTRIGYIVRYEVQNQAQEILRQQSMRQITQDETDE